MIDDLDKKIMEIINGEINSAVSVNGVLNSGAFPHPLTLARLAEQAEAFKKQFPVMPKYYRVNQRTYESLKKMSVPATDVFYRSITSVELHIDNDVPDGEAWPPDKRIEFVLHNPPIPDRFPSYVETVEDMPIAEAKKRWPDMFEKENNGTESKP